MLTLISNNLCAGYIGGLVLEQLLRVGRIGKVQYICISHACMCFLHALLHAHLHACIDMQPHQMHSHTYTVQRLYMQMNAKACVCCRLTLSFAQNKESHSKRD